MNKYLEKIAKTDEKFGVGTKIGIGYGGIVAGAIAMPHVQGATSKSLGKELATNGSVDKATLRKILKAEKLNVTFSAHKATGGDSILAEVLNRQGDRGGPHAIHADSNPQLHLKKNLVFGKPGKLAPGKTKNLDAVIHELGHIKDFSSRKNVNHLVKLKTFGDKHGLAAGSLVGMAMLSNDKTKDYAPLAPAVGYAPILHEEAAANYHGYKMLKRHGTKHMQNSFLKRIAAKNMLHYTAAPAVLSLGLYGAKKLIEKHDND